MKKQKYIVTLRKSYMEQHFEFDEGRLALAFAGIARETYIKDEENYKFSVSIDIEEIEEIEKPGNAVDKKIAEEAKKDEEV